MTEPVAWVDGRIVAPGQPALSPFDHALLTGDGVFETLRVYAGTPFALRRHLARLAASASGIGLDVPDEAVVRGAIDEVLAHLGVPDARLRITLTGGAAPLGSDRGTAAPTLVVAAAAMATWPPTAAVVRVPWVRNERSAVAGLKTVSYAENVVALAWARERGADEAIFGNTRGELCEGTGSNVFVVVDGRVCTPPLDSGCLGGITRELLVERTHAVEATLPLSVLDEADEVFITSSTRELQPVDSVDGRRIDAPGPHTRQLAAAFADLVATTPNP